MKQISNFAIIIGYVAAVFAVIGGRVNAGETKSLRRRTLATCYFRNDCNESAVIQVWDHGFDFTPEVLILGPGEKSDNIHYTGTGILVMGAKSHTSGLIGSDEDTLMCNWILWMGACPISVQDIDADGLVSLSFLCNE